MLFTIYAVKGTKSVIPRDSGAEERDKENEIAKRSLQTSSLSGDRIGINSFIGYLGCWSTKGFERLCKSIHSRTDEASSPVRIFLSWSDFPFYHLSQPRWRVSAAAAPNRILWLLILGRETLLKHSNLIKAWEYACERENKNPISHIFASSKTSS